MGRYFNLEQETKVICRNAKSVTKSDTNFTEAFVPRGEVRMAGDESDAVVVFKAVAAGSFLRIVVKAVLNATTATEILAIN